MTTVKAKRGQLAVYEEKHSTYHQKDGRRESVQYTLCLVLSVTRDGIAKMLRRPSGSSFPPNLTRHRVHIVPEGKADPVAAMKAAAAHVWEGSDSPKAFDTVEEIRELLKACPPSAEPQAKPKRPAAPAVLVVEQRKTLMFGGKTWVVALPAVNGDRSPILAHPCGTQTRARIIAGWMEATGFNWAAGYSRIGCRDDVANLCKVLSEDLQAAYFGRAPWPDEQPEKYTELLAALRPAGAVSPA